MLDCNLGEMIELNQKDTAHSCYQNTLYAMSWNKHMELS